MRLRSCTSLLKTWLTTTISTRPSPVLALLAEADKDARECEALLERAIEMVRGQPRRLPTKDPNKAAGETKPRARLVQILYDPDDAAYVAIDAQSGLSV